MRWGLKINREPEGVDAGGSFLGSAPPPPPGAGGPPAVGADGQPAPTGPTPPEWYLDKYAGFDAARYDDVKFWRDEYAPKVSTSYRSAEKLISSEKVPVPTNWEDEEQVSRYFKAAGWPDKADDYEFTRPDLPKDLPYDEDGEKYLRNVLHGIKIPKTQATKLYDNLAKLQIQRHAAWHEGQQKARGELEAAMAREYGPNVDRVKSEALTVVQQYADAQFKQYLDETGLGNDPRMVRFLANVAKSQGGETRLVGRAPPPANTADIEAQISEYRGKHMKALMDKTHPDHDMHVGKMKALYDQKNGI
jgi:hypothetical protein